MKRAVLIIFFSLFLALFSRSQEGYTHETGIISDNDAYLMLALDQYYTNGLMVYFRYVPENIQEKLENRIIEFQVGQKIFNPFQG